MLKIEKDFYLLKSKHEQKVKVNTEIVATLHSNQHVKSMLLSN